jgi:hypothetical protein
VASTRTRGEGIVDPSTLFESGKTTCDRCGQVNDLGASEALYRADDAAHDLGRYRGSPDRKRRSGEVNVRADAIDDGIKRQLPRQAADVAGLEGPIRSESHFKRPLAVSGGHRGIRHERRGALPRGVHDEARDPEPCLDDGGPGLIGGSLAGVPPSMRIAELIAVSKGSKNQPGGRCRQFTFTETSDAQHPRAFSYLYALTGLRRFRPRGLRSLSQAASTPSPR